MIHQKNHAKFDGSMDYEAFIVSWMPKVDLSNLESLQTDLIDLRKEFMKLRGTIFSEKMKLHSELCSKIGKSYPLDAIKNPYLYRALLLQQEQTT
jgi:hypothetical protein